MVNIRNHDDCMLAKAMLCLLDETDEGDYAQRLCSSLASRWKWAG